MVCEKGGDRRMSGDSHQDARRGLAKAPAETSAARRGGTGRRSDVSTRGSMPAHQHEVPPKQRPA